MSNQNNWLVITSTSAKGATRYFSGWLEGLDSWSGFIEYASIYADADDAQPDLLHLRLLGTSYRAHTPPALSRYNGEQT